MMLHMRSCVLIGTLLLFFLALCGEKVVWSLLVLENGDMMESGFLSKLDVVCATKVGENGIRLDLDVL